MAQLNFQGCQFILKNLFIGVFFLLLFLTLKFDVMNTNFFNLKSDEFLGGKNVHSLLIIGAILITSYRLGAFKK